MGPRTLVRGNDGRRFRFQPTSAGGNLHCGNVPGERPRQESELAILHFGYLDRENRIRKWQSSVR